MRNRRCAPLPVSGTITEVPLRFISSGDTITQGRVLRISCPMVGSNLTHQISPRAAISGLHHTVGAQESFNSRHLLL